MHVLLRVGLLLLHVRSTHRPCPSLSPWAELQADRKAALVGKNPLYVVGRGPSSRGFKLVRSCGAQIRVIDACVA